MNEKQDRSQVTGDLLTEPQDELNQLTGMYETKKEVEIRKANITFWPSLVGDSVEKSDGEEFEIFVPIFFDKAAKDTDEHIVCGIVYEPGDSEHTDSQGDYADEEEIRKACYQFMEDGIGFKVMHKGGAAQVSVLENYIAPQDVKIAGKFVKKGSWVMTTRINDAKLWKKIKAGELTGFSMAGVAAAE